MWKRRIDNYNVQFQITNVLKWYRLRWTSKIFENVIWEPNFVFEANHENCSFAFQQWRISISKFLEAGCVKYIGVLRVNFDFWKLNCIGHAFDYCTEILS